MDKEINNNGYEFVDLGLPSGTVWASCNIGASKPYDYGLYFQWGDTVGYTEKQVGKDKMFDGDNYKWNPIGYGKTFTKYITTRDKLNLEYDAARINMGGDWHMPSPDQIQELLDNTTIDCPTYNGVNGMAFTSKKDPSKYIFIPATGYASGSLVCFNGDYGFVWSSMLNTKNEDFGRFLVFDLDYAYLSSYGIYRNCGIPIRGVIG